MPGGSRSPGAGQERAYGQVPALPGSGALGPGPPGPPGPIGGSLPKVPKYDGKTDKDPRGYEKWEDASDAWCWQARKQIGKDEMALRLLKGLTDNALDAALKHKRMYCATMDGVDKLKVELKKACEEEPLFFLGDRMDDFADFEQNTGGAAAQAGAMQQAQSDPITLVLNKSQTLTDRHK